MKKTILLILILLLPINAHASFSECAFGDCVRPNSTVFYPDNVYAGFGNTFSSPDAKIFSDGTDLKISGGALEVGNGPSISLQGGTSTDEVGQAGCVKIGHSTTCGSMTVGNVSTVGGTSDLNTQNIKVNGVALFANATQFRAATTTSNSAPMFLPIGTLMTTPQKYAIETAADKIYWTIDTSTARKEIALIDATLTSGKVAVATTNGRLTNATTTGVAVLSSGTISAGTGTLNRALCWKTTSTLGSCTSVVAADGSCTCA